MSARIRRAQGPDWAICRALLPQACGRTEGPIAGLLLLPESGPRVGGAAVLRYDDHDAWVSLTILEPLRRQGLGTLLLESAMLAAEQGGAHRAVAGCDTIAQPAAEPFLVKHGFQAVARITTFEADLSTCAPTLRRMRDELVARQRVPAAWTITTLAQAPLQSIAQLFAEYIAHREDLAEAPLRLANEGGRWNSSPVLLVDGKPCAAIITEWRGDVWAVEGRFVVRGYQSGVANALLLGAAADHVIAQGGQRFQFDSRDDNADTLKLARRVQAKPIHIKTRFERLLITAALPLDA